MNEERPKKVRSELFLSAADEAMLANLATYRVLTIPQLVGLGVANRTHIGERLRTFRNAGWVKTLEVPFREGPWLHWLTPKGAEEVAALELLPEGMAAQFMPRPYRGGSQLRQRIAIVDFHIALRRWAEASGFSVDWFKVEFQKVAIEDGKKREFAPATRVTWKGHHYTPDGLGQITGPDGKSWLFALELETGGRLVSPDNHRKKLPERLRVMQNFEVERALKWSHKESLRLLFVFSDETMLAKAKKIAPDKGADVWQSIFFKSLPAVLDDFAENWWQTSGGTRTLFKVP